MPVEADFPALFDLLSDRNAANIPKTFNMIIDRYIRFDSFLVLLRLQRYCFSPKYTRET